MTGKQIFQSVVKDKNFPTVLGYYKIKCGAVELSMGRGFYGGYVYYVSVVKNNLHDHNLGKCFHSEVKARAYIKKLNTCNFN